MKYLLLIAIVFFCGCNNEDNTAKGSNTLAETQEQTLKDAVAQYPDSFILKESLIQYYREGGNYKNAIATVNSALEKDTTSARLWDIRATLNFENGDTAQAIHSFEKAVAIAADPVYIISLGTLYAETRNPNALIMADALLSSKAKAEKESYFIKGLYYSYNGEKEKSIPFFDKCLSLSYTYMDAYSEKALALYDLKKYNEALAVLDKALTLQNSYDEGYYYQGLCLEKLNRPAEAIESYQSALAYDPDYAEAKAALARLGVKN